MSGAIEHEVDQLLLEHGEYLPLELLLATGRLMLPDYQAWRAGEVAYLDQAEAFESLSSFQVVSMRRPQAWPGSGLSVQGLPVVGTLRLKWSARWRRASSSFRGQGRSGSAGGSVFGVASESVSTDPVVSGAVMLPGGASGATDSEAALGSRTVGSGSGVACQGSS